MLSGGIEDYRFAQISRIIETKFGSYVFQNSFVLTVFITAYCLFEVNKGISKKEKNNYFVYFYTIGFLIISWEKVS